MNELEDQVRGVRVSPPWDDARDQRVALGLRRRKRRRDQARRVAIVASLAVVLLVGTLAGTGGLANAAAAVRRWVANVVSAPAAVETVSSAPALPAPRSNERVARAPVTVEPFGQATSDAGLAEQGKGGETLAPSAERVAQKVPEKKSAASTTDWRSFARAQDFARAYEALRVDRRDVRDEPQDLLLASDVARLSNHPEDALAPLRRIVREHRSDSRAQLAAFTLGRVLLQDLKRPAEAAEAFAEARALDKNGSMSEDALAREVEAASLAGDAMRARARAEEYVATYPAGLRLDSVRRFGGLR